MKDLKGIVGGRQALQESRNAEAARKKDGSIERSAASNPSVSHRAPRGAAKSVGAGETAREYRGPVDIRYQAPGGGDSEQRGKGAASSMPSTGQPRSYGPRDSQDERAKPAEVQGLGLGELMPKVKAVAVVERDHRVLVPVANLLVG